LKSVVYLTLEINLFVKLSPLFLHSSMKSLTSYLPIMFQFVAIVIGSLRVVPNHLCKIHAAESVGSFVVHITNWYV